MKDTQNISLRSAIPTVPGQPAFCFSVTFFLACLAAMELEG
jgi:hypothetical protein